MNTVTFREETITLPTYAPGGYDKTPLFYTGRAARPHSFEASSTSWRAEST